MPSKPFPPKARRILCAAVLAVGLPLAQIAAGPTLESRPLAAPSGPAGATMFTELDPSATGVQTTNDYADPRMWGNLHHEFELGAIGTGVTIADYDRDGRPDIFIVSKTGSCRLFRNLGGMRFEDVTAQAGVGDPGDTARIWKQGAAFADVNNDGWPDLYVCRFDAPNLLYINQGDGTFREEAAARGVAIADASSMAAFCDYDRDGHLDLFLQTNLLDSASRPAGQPDYLLRNNGDGTFADVTESSGIGRADSQGHSATWWDFNNDGWPDLYVANDFDPSDKLYFNNRDGTFTDVIDSVVPHMPYSGMGADLGDINNDGRIDLLVADMATTSHEKDMRTMAGSRARMRDPPRGDASAPAYSWNAVYLNTGTSRVLEAARLLGLGATDWTWSPRFEDLDNDGWLDLHVTNGMHREIHNLDVLARMMGAESQVERIRIAQGSPVLVERNLAFKNTGDLRFEDVSAAWGLDQSGVSFGSALADLDGDGDLDLVFTNYKRGATVLRNDSQTGNRLIVELRGTLSNRDGVGATVRIATDSGAQVRQLVLARGYLSTSEPVLHFGLGHETVAYTMTVDWPSGHRQVFKNLSAGHRYTVTEPAFAPAELPPPLRSDAASRRDMTSESPPAAEPARPAPPMLSESAEAAGLLVHQREEAFDEIARQRLLPMRMDRRGPALAVGDLDGDGVDDIAIGSTTLDPLRLFIGGSDGRFRELGDGIHGSAGVVNGGPLLIFDADGDGRADILATRGGNSRPSGSPELQPMLYLNKGATFEPAPEGTVPDIFTSIGAAAAADIDGDGWLDLFLGGRVDTGNYPHPPRSYVLLNRGGRFEDATAGIASELLHIGMVTSALLSDLNGDARPDLVLTLEWENIRVFLNTDGKLTDATAALRFDSAGTGLWTSLATADFNGDGRPDFVAGNIGLNTSYTAPATLYAGDFRGDGTTTLLEARTIDGQLFPVRSRRELAAAIPSLSRRIPTNDRFATLTLGEIVGAEALAAARRLDATELRSGILMSRPDGTWRWEPLPRIAQIAPLQGIVAGDFDGDEYADVLVVQNSFTASSVTGRFDGGLGVLLLNNGYANFEALPPDRSGLVVAGDAKALAVVDSDGNGSLDFLVSRNDSTTLLFRNRSPARGGWLRVSLQGPAGNPTAIGARVTATHADGVKQNVETGSGSGWMSQSSAVVFLGNHPRNPIRSITVRWLDGTVSEHEPSASGVLMVKQP